MVNGATTPIEEEEDLTLDPLIFEELTGTQIAEEGVIEPEVTGEVITPEVKIATADEPVIDRDEIIEPITEVAPPELTRETVANLIAKGQVDPESLTSDERTLLAQVRARQGLGETLGQIFGEEEAVTPEALLGGEDAQTIAEDILGGTGIFAGQGSSIKFDEARIRRQLEDNGFSSSQIDQIINRKRAIEGEERIKAETEERITTQEDLLQEKLDKQVADIEEAGLKREEQLQRLRSLRGVGRSTATERDLLAVQEQTADLISTAQKQSELELSIFRARQEGASAETISSLRKNLAETEILVQQKLNATLLAQQELNNQIAGDFSAAVDSMFETINSVDPDLSQTIDINKTKELNLGYFLDSEGNVVVGKDGKPIIYKQPDSANIASKGTNIQFISAKADDFGNIIQPGGYFNKATQTFTPIDFGGEMGVGEFPTAIGISPEQGGATATQIAEFTQIYKGSPANPNGIDLAGNRGSAIKTPISGEVIFVGERGPWGNQVQVRDANGNVHQFSHLEGAIVKVGDRVSTGTQLGTMGNSGNVLKGDGTKPTEEELAAGRGTHLDYTVFDTDGKAFGLDVAMSFAGIPNTSGKTSQTSEALEKGYKTIAQQKIYNQIIKEGGTPPDLSALNLNEGQSKSVGFSNRMGNDLDIMTQFRTILSDLNVTELAGYRKLFGTTLGNQFVPAEVQQYLQAERDFIQAQLRKESGAAIAAEELENLVKTIGIQPGDSAAVIEQKFNLMQTMLGAMIDTAGPGRKLITTPGFDEEDETFFGETGAGVTLDAEDEAFFEGLK